MLAAPGYVAISRRTLDLEDYIDLARRHVTWIVAPTFAGLVISIVIAFILQNTYLSQAEMAILPSQISANIVTSTISQRLNERMAQMEQEILSRQTLSGIIQDPRLNLYKSELATKPLEDVIETMRTRDIKIAAVVPPGGERQASAFTVSFQYSNPEKAQMVVERLIAKFQDFNETTQRDAQTQLTSLVGDELKESKDKLNRLDDELTKFRVDHPGELPEQESLNMAELTSSQGQLSAVNDSLSRAAQTRVQLESRLDNLKDQTQLLTMLDKEESATDLPLTRRQNERLQLLEKQIGDGDATLAQLKLRFKSTYPDIRDMENSLELLRKQRDDLQKKQENEEAKTKAEAKPLAAPNYQQAQSASNLQGQINSTNSALTALSMEERNLKGQQQVIDKRMGLYQQRLQNTSAIEAQYAELTRAHKLAEDEYQITQTKQQLSDQNNELLTRRAGERLEILDSPNLPTQPFKPQRWEWVGGGTATSFFVGLALAGLQEARDKSLKNLKDVRAYTNLPVLSSIPLLENTTRVRRQRRLAYLAWSAGVILGMLAITASLYYHYTPS